MNRWLTNQQRVMEARGVCVCARLLACMKTCVCVCVCVCVCARTSMYGVPMHAASVCICVDYAAVCMFVFRPVQ